MASLSFSSIIFELRMTIHPSEAREDQIGSPHCTTSGSAVPIFIFAVAGGLGLNESTLALWAEIKSQLTGAVVMHKSNHREAGVTAGQQAAQGPPGFVLQGRAGL